MLEGVTTVRSMLPDGSDARVDVRERQETPRIGLGRIGVIGARATPLPSAPPRVGWVQIERDAEISDRDAHAWARTVEDYCAAAVQQAGRARVSVQLPGAVGGSHGDAAEASVAQGRAQWVDSCGQ